MWYVLDENKQPYRVPVEEYVKLDYDPVMKIVQQDKIKDGNAEVFISTVFLGLDHGIGDRESPNYKPVLWETMIFEGEYSDYQEIYIS
jgi:hypothetical protein